MHDQSFGRRLVIVAALFAALFCIGSGGLSSLGLAVWLGLGDGDAEPPPAAPVPLSVKAATYALLALDTNDASIGDTVKVDRATVSGLLAALPPEALSITLMEGKHLSYENVFTWLAQVRPAASDTLFIYFSGHGTTDRAAGHCLAMPGGRLVERWKLLEEAQRKHARLTVLLTDCCAGLSERRTEYGELPPADRARVVRKLLFGHRGLVDLNACRTGQFAGCDGRGGFFTAALALECDKAARKGDAPNWQQLLPRIVGTVEDWSRQTKYPQTPAAMSPIEGAVPE